MRRLLHCTLPDRLDALEPLADRVEAALAPYRLPERASFGLRMALDEIFSNALKHRPGDGETNFSVDLSLKPDGLELIMRYDGPEFDILAAPDPRLDAPTTERPIGGLGLHLVREWMDEIQYSHKEGRNELKLAVRLDEPCK